jgi:protein O-GlcNAc transferase
MRSVSWRTRRRAAAAFSASSDKRLVLHVGCGPRHTLSLHERFRGPGWREIRLDVDPGVEPDVVASIANMHPVPSAAVDAVWSSHNIEHVFAHEVRKVMEEFLRVLKPGGEVLLATPDLQSIGAALARGRLEDPLYTCPVGNVSPLDILYGFGGEIESGHEYMAHRTGFTATTLARRLSRAGFIEVEISRDSYELRASARRPR